MRPCAVSTVAACCVRCLGNTETERDRQRADVSRNRRTRRRQHQHPYHRVAAAPLPSNRHLDYGRLLSNRADHALMQLLARRGPDRPEMTSSRRRLPVVSVADVAEPDRRIQLTEDRDVSSRVQSTEDRRAPSGAAPSAAASPVDLFPVPVCPPSLVGHVFPGAYEMLASAAALSSLRRAVAVTPPLLLPVARTSSSSSSRRYDVISASISAAAAAAAAALLPPWSSLGARPQLGHGGEGVLDLVVGSPRGTVEDRLETVSSQESVDDATEHIKGSSSPCDGASPRQRACVWRPY